MIADPVDDEPEPAPAWGAGWSREGLVAGSVEMAELGFGIVRLWPPLSADRRSCGDPHDGTGRRRLGPDSIGKHPVDDAWQTTAEHDPGRVRTMMGNPGNRSYGAIAPPGVFAWDVDGTVPTKLAELAGTLGPLPQTRRHATGKGEHAFYRWPEDVPGGSWNLFGIVTRRSSPAGQVVGPGSIHAATGRLCRTVISPMACYPSTTALRLAGVPVGLPLLIFIPACDTDSRANRLERWSFRVGGPTAHVYSSRQEPWQSPRQET